MIFHIRNIHSHQIGPNSLSNQAVKKLKPGESMDRCPRCGGPSIVHPESEPLPKSPSPQKLKANLLLRRKGYSLPIPNTNKASPIAKAWKSFDECKKSEVVVSEYADCTRKACAFSYCKNCHCERHVDGKCPWPPISSSPKSDEDTRDKRPSDKRRALRRLLK